MAEFITTITEKMINQLRCARFIQKCIDQSITRGELDRFIVQHAYYARCFTRYLCAVLSNLEDLEDFNQLLKNLSEEMGLKHSAKVPHSLLYQNMMQKLKVDLSMPMQLATKQLIDAMFYYCRKANPIYGIAAICLGAEAIVPELYSHIVRGFNFYHIDNEDLEFLTIHIHCDDEHAETLRHILQKSLSRHAYYSRIIYKVGNEMINHRINFLDSLLDETL